MFQQEDAASTYGLTKQEALFNECRELAKCKTLPADARKILMGTSKEFVLQWLRSKQGQCALLKVPYSSLSDSEVEQLQAGIAVLGEAVVRVGELIPVE